MDYNKEHIDDLFKKWLGDYAEAPPPAAWDALEKRLDGASGRRVFFWPWFSNNRKGFLLGLLGVLLLSSAILFYNRNTSGNMIADHYSKPADMPVAAQALNTPPSTITTATNAQDNINANPTKTVTVLNTGNKTKATINNDNTSSVDNPTIKQPESQDETATANSNETEKNDAANASATPVQQVATLTTQSTDKGNIHIQQEVIEKQPVESSQPKDILLASNGSGSAVITKRHGIVVQSLPDEQATHPKAIIYYSAPVPETVASTNTAHKEDKRITKSIVKKQSAITTAQKPITTKQVYAAANNKHAVKSIAAGKNGKGTSTIVAAVETAPAQKVKPIVAAKRKPIKSLAAKTKPVAITPASAIAENKKSIVAKKKAAVPAKTDMALLNNKQEKTHKQASGIAARKQNMSRATAQLPPATFVAQQPTANTFSSNRPAQAILPKAAVTNNVAMQSIAARTFNNMPAGPAVNLGMPLLTTTGGAGMDTAGTAKKRKRFEYGIKAGYEGGFTSEAARKIVGAPYIQYNFGSRFSIMSQPAFKAASVGNRALNGSQTFYSVDQSSSSVRLDSTVTKLIITAPGTPIDTLVLRYYSYKQARSNVTKSYQYGGTYFEFEIPLLAKYSLTKNLSIYGGPDLVYGKTIDVTEVTKTSASIEATGSATTLAHGSQAPPTPPAIGSVITYTGTPLSGYKGPLYPVSSGDLFRLGYMLGASYELNKRYLFDVLMEQSGAPANNEGGYNVNKPLSSLYFRFTIGYRLSK